VTCDDGSLVADHERLWAKHHTISDPKHLAAARAPRRGRIDLLRPAAETEVGAIGTTEFVKRQETYGPRHQRRPAGPAWCFSIASGYLHPRALEVHGSQTTVLAMGALTTNRSTLPGSGTRSAAAASQSHHGAGGSAGVEPDVADHRHARGSFYFDNQPNVLDQFPATKNMAIDDALIKVGPTTVKIFKLSAMVNPGVYPKPIPFGGMGKPVNRMDSPTTSRSP
jgi:hypothetical protein